MTRRETLIAYLLSSVEAEDWHAVRDAAVDIEVLDARNAQRHPREHCRHPANLPVPTYGCGCYACFSAHFHAAGPTPP